MLSLAGAARAATRRAGFGALAACRSAAPLARRCLSAAAAGADDSHSDFKPKTKVSPNDPEALKAQIDELVHKHKVVLFMKGTPSQPMCGFSATTVRLLHQHGVDVTGVDVLSNPIMRTAMKEYSQWPTFPQLYVAGEFVGGCDIATQMHQSGELAKLLEDKVKGGKAQ